MCSRQARVPGPYPGYGMRAAQIGLRPDRLF